MTGLWRTMGTISLDVLAALLGRCFGRTVDRVSQPEVQQDR